MARFRTDQSRMSSLRSQQILLYPGTPYSGGPTASFWHCEEGRASLVRQQCAYMKVAFKTSAHRLKRGAHRKQWQAQFPYSTQWPGCSCHSNFCNYRALINFHANCFQQQLINTDPRLLVESRVNLLPKEASGAWQLAKSGFAQQF